MIKRFIPFLAISLGFIAVGTSVSAGTIYDSKSSPAAIAIDQQVKAEMATKVYPKDPTPAYMLTYAQCSRKSPNGTCLNVYGGGGAGGSAGE